MNTQKNKVWGFLFSLLPGAGHMYLGIMKEGVSFMVLFFGIIALASFLNIPLIIFAIPVVWFYSFFDYLNKSNLTQEQLASYEDKYLFLDGTLPALKTAKMRKYLGWGAIAIGLWLLWDRFGVSAFYQLSETLGINFLNPSYIVQAVVAVVVIIIGIRLLRGKKKELITKEDDTCEPAEWAP